MLAPLSNQLGPMGVSRPAADGNPGKTSLLALWAIDEASGNALDSHTNSLTLTQVNTVARVTGKVAGAGQTVYASQQYFTRASEALLQFGAVSFTIGGWYQNGSNAVTSYFISKDTNVNPNREFALHSLGNGSLRFIRGIACDNNSFIGNDVWGFFLARWDHTTLQASLQINNNTAVVSTAASNATAGSAPFQIGARTSGSARYSTGKLDNFFIYKGRILTDAEGAWWYNSGNARAYSELAA